MNRHLSISERLARLAHYREARMPLGRVIAAVVFKLRAALMIPLLAVLLLCTLREWERESLLWPTGLALFLVSVGVRVWCQRHLRYRLKNEEGLAVAGPFAHVRNPIYLANTLLLVSLTILCEVIWMIPVTIAWCLLVYNVAVRFEEWRLTIRYGDSYLQYCQRTPRWIPRLVTGLPIPEVRRASWMRAATAEWQCVLLLALPILKECLW